MAYVTVGLAPLSDHVIVIICVQHNRKLFARSGCGVRCVIIGAG